jgi:hypothetical protein
MLRRLISPALALAALLSVITVVQPAYGSASSSFVSKINSARRSAGRPALSVRGDLAAVAYRQAQRMASKDALYHNPNLGSEVRGWQVVGENVGRGGDVPSLHQAFMRSSTHRANILDRDYTEVGVGVVVDGDGIMWVSEVFRQPYRQAAAPKPRTRPTAGPPTRTTSRPTPTRAAPAGRPATPPKRVAVLQARVAALTARPLTPAAGALSKALRYLQVMAALTG